jgi:hypothetical protein
MIRFLWSESMKTVETCGRIRVHCGDECMNRRKFTNLVEIFKLGGEANVTDVRSGHPSFITCSG